MGEDTLKVELDNLINTYYSGEVVDEAREILKGLENKSTEPEETRFELDLNEEHYYILALEGDEPILIKPKLLSPTLIVSSIILRSIKLKV
ncbi:MAG: hypothetical protein CM15mP23_08000 [Cryomorphaceae bacterium]|nr:MAG: hypothetical protein CM15mP23_08000 [Cryomorphaceae bacterium]